MCVHYWGPGWNVCVNVLLEYCQKFKKKRTKRGEEMGERSEGRKRGGIVWKMGSPRRFGRNTVAWLQPCYYEGPSWWQ